MRLGNTDARQLLVGWRRMVDAPWQVLDSLVEAAAQRHVQFLEAAADRQQRDAGGDRRTDQRQRGRIPGDVLRRAFGMRRAFIEIRTDIGPAAGQDQPVQPRQDLRRQRLPRRRQQNGDAADRAEARRLFDRGYTEAQPVRRFRLP
jgi:hypothetical protein